MNSLFFQLYCGLGDLSAENTLGQERGAVCLLDWRIRGKACNHCRRGSSRSENTYVLFELCQVQLQMCYVLTCFKPHHRPTVGSIMIIHILWIKNLRNRGVAWLMKGTRILNTVVVGEGNGVMWGKKGDNQGNSFPLPHLVSNPPTCKAPLNSPLAFFLG